MLKNLFDYATKELSQDAFLRWFFENYEDDEIGPIVIDFINAFTRGQIDSSKRKPLELSFGDIQTIKTFSQINDIDVSVDIYAKQFNGSHKTIVIEDKTESEEHRQLKEYNKKISAWGEYGQLSPDECVYKIFYKTSMIEEKESARVVDAGWTPFDINSIYKFFKDRGNTKSQVFNDYVRHIIKTYDSYHLISQEKADEWNFNNWNTFFKANMEQSFPNVPCYTQQFRGMYNSLIVNYYLENNQVLKCATLEIQIRGELKPYIHPSFNCNGDWHWSINAVEDEQAFLKAKEELNELRQFIEKKKSKIIRRANTARAFAKANKMPYKGKLSDEVWLELKKLINEFEAILQEYSKQAFIK